MTDYLDQQFLLRTACYATDCYNSQFSQGSTGRRQYMQFVRIHTSFSDTCRTWRSEYNLLILRDICLECTPDRSKGSHVTHTCCDNCIALIILWWVLQADRKVPMQLRKHSATLCYKWGIPKHRLGGINDLCHMRVGATSNTYSNRTHNTFTLTYIISDLCHVPVRVTSNTYCNPKHCTFTVTSALTHILHLIIV